MVINMIIRLTLNEENLVKIVDGAVRVILNGGCIIYPTDTVYGFGADATNQPAVERIFEIKGRKEGRGISSIFQSIDQIKQYTKLTFGQEKILRKYLPGPYTFLLKPAVNIKLASRLIDEKEGTIGVRIPNHPFTKALAEVLDKPYTCTSANASGLPSPKSSREVEEYLLKPANLSLRGSRLSAGRRQVMKQLIEGILFIDAGALAGLPSTVIDLTKIPPAVVRRGSGEWRR